MTTEPTNSPVQLIVGPPEHGVTRLALELAEHLPHVPVVRVIDGRELPPLTGPAHVHVTDRLFGASPEEAAERLVALADAVPLTVTLHDLPQASDGPRNHPRRSAAYAAIARAARAVVVSSEHERALLAEVAPDVTPVVVPLPIDGGPVATRVAPTHPRDVVLLGFVYPGKGHEEAIDALAGLPDDVGLLNLGKASDGHEDLVDELTARAHQSGRRFVVTGYVPDDELTARLHAAAVPVAAHRHLSASGSINSWLAAGRRPLVPRGRYTEELAARCPGSVTLYDDLGPAIGLALADPESTWLGPDVVVGPSRAQVARHYAQVMGA